MTIGSTFFFLCLVQFATCNTEHRVFVCDTTHRVNRTCAICSFSDTLESMQCSYTAELDGFCGAGKYTSKKIFQEVYEENQLYVQMIPTNFVLLDNNTMESTTSIIYRLQDMLQNINAEPGSEFFYENVVIQCNSCPDNYTSPVLSTSVDNCTLVSGTQPDITHDENSTEPEHIHQPTESDNTPQENTTEHENIPQPTEPTQPDNTPQENTTEPESIPQPTGHVIP